MKLLLVSLAVLAGKLSAAPVAASMAAGSNELAFPGDAAEAHFRGGDADQAYHTITPHHEDKFRGDDADQAYHTITPHHEDKFRGDDADQAYHTITPHNE